MSSLCTDIGYLRLNKIGEILCGDRVEIVKKDNGDVIVVLADGLGSGVKASILSILTAKIISTMVAEGMSLEDCVRAVAASLPVCKVRGIAYSTFTIVRIADNLEAEIIQYDNPHVILLRGGSCLEFSKSAEIIDGKEIYKSYVKLEENDTFIAVSDGAVHAGVGKRLNFGWQRQHIIRFMEGRYRPHYTAKTLAAILIEECSMLYDDEPGDDTTVCALKIRRRKPMNLLIGPPANPADVYRMMSSFFSEGGKHVVCGGTTANLAAKFLEKPIYALGYVDAEVPPIARIEGVDLVTEGVVTISHVLNYSLDYIADNKRYPDWGQKNDGASLIARLLFEEATDIKFYVGRAVNKAHQTPELPVGLSSKMQLVEKLVDSLKQMGKRIEVSYF